MVDAPGVVLAACFAGAAPLSHSLDSYDPVPNPGDYGGGSSCSVQGDYHSACTDTKGSPGCHMTT
ncbi:hypothetical protein KAW18_00590 [candidate division WOR-3 bacterium]|nr:hypothetical protein [candidate division WOR-3 bacterium]